MDAILTIRELSKDFRDNWTLRRFRVLDALDLQVRRGEIFGLIGPNGAGKTTTFKLLLGLLRPSRGSVEFEGRPLLQNERAKIGFLPEQPYFYDHLTVEEALDLYARLYGIPGAARRRRVDEVIEQVRLGHKRRAALRTLSKGTLQRVGVGQAILNHPRLIILDEPMSGLDPAGRRHLRELISSLQQEGTTVIFSSHILPDAEALCHRVGILAGGRLREVIDLNRQSTESAYVLTTREISAVTVETLRGLSSEPPAPVGIYWRLRLPDPTAVAAALDVIRQGGGHIESLEPIHPSLEERFLTLVGDAPELD